MPLYLNQKVRVWSKPERPDNGEIRITFAEKSPEPVTLALSITDASWLAAMIQLEIRKVERKDGE